MISRIKTIAFKIRTIILVLTAPIWILTLILWYAIFHDGTIVDGAYEEMRKRENDDE